MACFPKELESLSPAAGAIVTSCAWCGRVKHADGAWGKAEPANPNDPNDTKTHGICPDCMSSEMFRGKD